MRRLIRAKATRAFLTEDGTWTHNLAKAATFDDSALAIAAKSRFRLEDVELYYSFDDHQRSPWDFVLGLRQPTSGSVRS